MVNPFSTFYSQQLNLPTQWSDCFENPALPVTIDVGCARGTMLDLLAEKHPARNFVGIEIRPKLVEEANERNQSRPNVHFIAGNFSSMEAKRLIDSFQGICPIEWICFQFPDPWRKKKKQQRRRILQQGLVDVLASSCEIGTRIYVSTDVKDLAVDNRTLLAGSTQLKLVVEEVEEGGGGKGQEKGQEEEAPMGSTTTTTGSVQGEDGPRDSGWLNKSVLSVPSERELVCEQDWRPVWRACFVVCGTEGSSSRCSKYSR
jgi:tRNA (guanine-N7-)-methyltransferase